LEDIIYKHAGGITDGKKIKCVIPGGSSMPPLTADEIPGLKMDNESLKAVNSAIGTGGIIVMNEYTDIVKVVRRIAQFYYHESCGQCTPCREGCGWMLRILRRIEEGSGRNEDLDLLVNVASNIEGNTICAFGDAAAWPVKYSVKKFLSDFEAKIGKNVTIPALNKVHSLRKETANTNS
jgi:NADH-quinone oxidoreductase subunit F